MIAFATKVNFITMLTGTSHEKLQVFHRWSALVMYITSLVHTFPFVVQAFQLDEMEIQWKTNWYWTGVAALVPQTYLVFLSWGLFRNKYYETFKKLHFLAAALFMVFLFIHCCFRLTSWDYFAATAAIYFLAWFFRFFRSLYNTGLGVPASIEVLPDGRTLKLTVLTPSRVKWSPGQHVFLRFLNSGIHVFSSHPFTISSLSSDGAMEFVFNIHGGVTRKLAAMAEGKASVSTRVIVDGPYGGVPSLEGYDHVYLLAGGTGVSLTLPLLSNLVKAKGKSKSVEFVVAVKKRETATWIEDQVSNKHMDNLTRRIHITDPEEQSGMPKLLKGGGSENSSLSEKGKKSTGSDSEVQLISGRPNLPSLIHEAHRTQSGKTAVIACGPESFLYDVRNAVAEAQLVLADGYGACTDLFLHTETYK
ncbi:hypothetical protein V5O48_006729 [Marasmius crinis-equi]|uniref:ferric-chelate reductase (NADPH) n=1 Tax=Marasmius crinis-equi TaxID=585013 RepID=A0ABR3FIQ0_9AGAR